MLENMSWDLLRAWIQYIEVEPFGSVSENLQRGVIAAMIGNANINPKKTKPFKAQDFLLGVLPTKKEVKSKLTDEQKAAAQQTNRKIKMQAMMRAQQLKTAYQEKRRNNHKRLTANRLPKG